MTPREYVAPNGNRFRIVRDSVVARGNDRSHRPVPSSKPRKHKYNAQAVVVDGVRFASKAEAERYIVLRDKARNGDIYDLKLQPRFRIEVSGVHICDYLADFSYIRRGVSKRTVEDVKGVKTPVFRLKWKLAQVLHPHHDWKIS